MSQSFYDLALWGLKVGPWVLLGFILLGLFVFCQSATEAGFFDWDADGADHEGEDDDWDSDILDIRRDDGGHDGGKHDSGDHDNGDHDNGDHDNGKRAA